MATIDRWAALLSSQAGLIVSREGMEFNLKPENVFQNADSKLDPETFEYEFQLPLETQFTLTVNGKETACVCTDSPVQNRYYVDVRDPVRVPVEAGDTLKVVLEARWTDRKKKACSQIVMDGAVKFPVSMQTMGAPGVQVYVPHLKSLAYFGVGNIRLRDGRIQQEIISFNIILMM
jgi:hypothetical protein